MIAELEKQLADIQVELKKTFLEYKKSNGGYKIKSEILTLCVKQRNLNEQVKRHKEAGQTDYLRQLGLMQPQAKRDLLNWQQQQRHSRLFASQRSHKNKTVNGASKLVRRERRSRLRCLECRCGGELARCSVCLAAYHSVCVNLTSFPPKWQCHRCIHVGFSESISSLSGDQN